MNLERLGQLNEETAAALRHEQRVFERIARVGKWVAVVLIAAAVGMLVKAYLTGGLPAVAVLVSGK